MSVYKKLIDVQTKLKAPKNQYNSFGKYSYRNCEDILEALKPILKEVGATILISDEVVPVNERYYVKATVKFIDTETGEVVEASANAREEDNKKGMDSSQLTGSTSSYARKYALNGLFAIDDTRDSDHPITYDEEDKEENKKENKKSIQVISEAQAKRMYMLAKGKDPDIIKQILSEAGFNSSKAITRDKYNYICEQIEAI